MQIPKLLKKFYGQPVTLCVLKVWAFSLEPFSLMLYNFEKPSGWAEKLLGRAEPGWSAYSP